MGFLHLDGTPVVEEILGFGSSGVVIQDGQFALKIPRLWPGVDLPEDGRLGPDEDGFDMRLFRIDQIRREKEILRRLGAGRGIVQCFDLQSPTVSIRMRRMKGGDLRSYLARNRPDRPTQLRWLTEMAHTLAYVHRRRVIVADLRSDNFLVDENLSIKISDFGESVMLPMDWDMKHPDWDGESVSNDIGKFGAVMFEVITGQPCNFNLLQGWKEPGDPLTWPDRASLPPTAGLWLGQIVEACWVQGTFASADELAAALEGHRVEQMSQLSQGPASSRIAT